MVFIYIYIMINQGQNFFLCFLATCMSSFLWYLLSLVLNFVGFFTLNREEGKEGRKEAEREGREGEGKEQNWSFHQATPQESLVVSN